jgi:propionyl-CoA carboxylase alpha chain
MKITKLLVANRGEIALRIMRTAKEMGIATVAVYSDADRHAPHVRFADEAYHIGPAPSAESYLRMDKLISIAKICGATAIHPGYGFLSENAEFSRLVTASGLIFVGPSPHSIQVMGSKIAAKQAVAKYNIPLVPGMETPITDVSVAKVRAAEIGYPVLIKASAGGGGKGMRVVTSEAEFDEQMTRAVNEAQASFGDAAVFIEKYISSPKHIEFQVVGDQHGNVIHLFERECSIQRRHQKVVEEAPSSCLTPEVRAAMGADAVGVAKACGYYGAGTVEFIVDDQLNYYFLEMNTRLQVEHPVTEEITGVDLVRMQIMVAEGQSLPIKQEDLTMRGHAIEIRVCAEDPANNFLPDIGRLNTYIRPQGPGIRVDDGLEQGMEISVFYDPMVAKLITYAATRQEAIDRMRRAIAEYQITGIQTTLGFCDFVMQHEAFVSGKFDTGFVAKYFSPEVLAPKASPAQQESAALLATMLQDGKTGAVTKSTTQLNGASNTTSAWKLRAK